MKQRSRWERLSNILIALGGNAILQPGQKGTYEEQLQNISISCGKLVKLYMSGYRMAITHGNGPQVGNLLIQNQRANDILPMQPLYSCVAQTQGQIGFMIQSVLENQFRLKGLEVHAPVILTRVLVDAVDPAFSKSTKPIGPFFDEEYAKEKITQGETWMQDSNRGWRKVVPSPRPVKILELDIIRQTLDQNGITIAVGGGGIPVISKGEQVVGVEAVIDKDLAGSLLARELEVDAFVILTDVAHAKINYGQPNEVDLTHITIEEAESYLAAGQFGVGSMAPKVQAAVEFVRYTGKRAIITSLEGIEAAIKGEIGTIITNSPRYDVTPKS